MFVGPKSLVGFAMCAILGLAACSSASIATPGQQTPADVAPDPLADMALPIDQVLFGTASDRVTLQRGVDALVAKCMSALNLKYIPYPLDIFDPLDLHFRYGFITIADAESVGYDRFSITNQTSLDTDAAIDDARHQISPSYDAALYGTGQNIGGGCVELAERQIYGVQGGVSNLPGFKGVLYYQHESNTQLYEGQVANRLQVAWSQCMEAAGYNYVRWQDARNAKSPARGQAVADAVCRSQTHLEVGLFNEESKILGRILTAREEEVSTFETVVRDSVDRARSAATK